jgi:predicted dehydrogenase
VGVVGGGLIAQVVHLPLLEEYGRHFTIAALAEPSRRVREVLARRYAVPCAFADHREMVERGGLDAVLVASPNGTHAEVVLECLNHGLDVLVEKPLCLTVDDADRIIAARDRTGRVVHVGYMKRYDPAFEALLADAQRGVQIRHISSITHDPGLARLYAPADMFIADDVGEDVIEAVRSTTAAQVRQAVGSDDPGLVRAFSDGFLGALIHDVNVVHVTLAELGHETVAVRDASASPDGQALTGVVDLGDGVTWTMAWLLLPAVDSFDETIRLYTEDAIRTLRFPAPYGGHLSATYEIERGGDGASSGRSFRSHRDGYRGQLMSFHSSIVAGTPCRTPPEEARRDIALLTDLFRHVAGSSRVGPDTSRSPPSTVNELPVT